MQPIDPPDAMTQNRLSYYFAHRAKPWQRPGVLRNLDKAPHVGHSMTSLVVQAPPWGPSAPYFPAPRWKLLPDTSPSYSHLPAREPTRAMAELGTTLVPSRKHLKLRRWHWLQFGWRILGSHPSLSLSQEIDTCTVRLNSPAIAGIWVFCFVYIHIFNFY